MITSHLWQLKNINFNLMFLTLSFFTSKMQKLYSWTTVFSPRFVLPSKFQWHPVSVSSGCYRKHHRLGTDKLQTFISQSGGWMFRIKEPAGSESSEDPLPGSQTASLPASSRGGEQRQRNMYFHKITDPVLEALPSWPHIPEAPPPDTTTLEWGVSTWIWGPHSSHSTPPIVWLLLQPEAKGLVHCHGPLGNRVVRTAPSGKKSNIPFYRKLTPKEV